MKRAKEAINFRVELGRSFHQLGTVKIKVWHVGLKNKDIRVKI